MTAATGPDTGSRGEDEPGSAAGPGCRIGIVVPCFNEAHRLRPDAFSEFARRGQVRFLFVNDGSTDDTRAVLGALSRDAPAQVAVLDLATPLDAIPAFAAILDGEPRLEMVFGARVLLMGRSIRRSSTRHYAGRLFATAVSLVLGLPIYDTQCGAKLFRATPAVQALFQAPFRSRWIFDVELVARLVRARRGTRAPSPAEVIHEHPLEQWHDVPGSKVRAVDFARAAVELARIYRAYLR